MLPSLVSGLVFQRLEIVSQFQGQDIPPDHRKKPRCLRLILKRKTLIFRKKFRKCIDFWKFFREKLSPIEQHKPHISEHSFLKMQ